jgi:hypothetical protein
LGDSAFCTWIHYSVAVLTGFPGIQITLWASAADETSGFVFGVIGCFSGSHHWAADSDQGPGSRGKDWFPSGLMFINQTILFCCCLEQAA